MLGACFGDAWGSLGGPLGSFGCLLGGPWASLEAVGASWDRPGGPWGDFGGLGRSLGQSRDIKKLIFWVLGCILRCNAF